MGLSTIGSPLPLPPPLPPDPLPSQKWLCNNQFSLLKKHSLWFLSSFAEQGEEAFTCPTCRGQSLKACDDNTINEKCQGAENPVCVLSRSVSRTRGVTTYRRGCTSRKRYNSDKDFCDKHPERCSVAMCDKSGCKAEFAVQGISWLLCLVNIFHSENEQFKAPFY